MKIVDERKEELMVAFATLTPCAVFKFNGHVYMKTLMPSAGTTNAVLLSDTNGGGLVTFPVTVSVRPYRNAVLDLGEVA